LNEALVRQAGLIVLYLPMHTATRLAVELIPRLKSLNAKSNLCCYGLYAPVNESYLRSLGVDTILGGEFESGIVALYDRIVATNGQVHDSGQRQAPISLEKQQFLLPDRISLPPLNAYAQLHLPDGSLRQVGYTEASRGCKYLCRHCPIVPVYNGRFRIIQAQVVLADIRQQVAAGAQHITFGDPDFLNGPGHAMPIVKALHDEFPHLTYDVTIKIEHLLKYDHLLPVLRDTGCLFITSAVEAVDDHILHLMDKRHTRADFLQAAKHLRQLGLVLNPTFVAFTPWTTASGYLQMLSALRDLDLVSNMAPIQYAIRLLIPAGSRLLELPEVRNLVAPFDQAALCYPWQHPDPAMDQLYQRIFRLVQQNQSNRQSRNDLFNKVWQAVSDLTPDPQPYSINDWGKVLSTRPIPQLSESWY
jgi:radical SAM superfamily enzyme YgiQ (UPF0313 family)